MDLAGGIHVDVDHGTTGGARRRYIGPLGVGDAGHDGPVARAPVVLAGIEQLQRAAGAAGSGGPGRRTRIAESSYHLCIGRLACRQEREQPAIRIQCARKGVEQGNRSAISGGVSGPIRRQHNEAAGADERARRKVVGNLGDLPAGEIEGRGGGGVEQLEKLGPGQGRITHDLIKDDLSRGR